jgi:hypothetical protein
MRRFRIVVLCLVGACAGAAFAATSASAALPELGRCVADTGKGAFTRSNCIGISKTHTGGFEWEAGPGASKGFKAIMTGFKLETTEGIKISCANAQITGEYTGAKSLKTSEVLLEGCELVGPLHQPCYSNPLEKGKIVSTNADAGELGFIPGSKLENVPFAGWDLKSENALMPFLTFTCGEGGGALMISLEGSVIGHVTKTNVMTSSFSLNYKQKEGIQIPTSFIGGAEDVLKMITRPLGGETKTEQAGLASGGSITDGEPLEIKVRP